MGRQQERAQGVTPGLSHDYADRTAQLQAGFAMPLLRPGMDLLDIGCGPGTITMGLARAVAPGVVVGIDHDEDHVEAARSLARRRGINARFHVADARSLPFADATFDVTFENDVFTHLAGDAISAAREAHRVLRPDGMLAARDVEADAAVWGRQSDAMKRFDRLFLVWQRARGSDLAIGRRLPELLRRAGFADIVTSVSADTKERPGDVRAHARIMTFLVDGPVGRFGLDRALVDTDGLASMRRSIRAWGSDPDAFFAAVHVETVGWKRDASAGSR